mgnify:CR=1 FL=1
MTFRYNRGSAFAWIVYSNSTGISILQSYNVASVTDNAVGTATIHYSNAMANAQPCIAGCAGSTSVRGIMQTTDVAATTTSVRILGFIPSSAAADDFGRNMIVIYGDRA